MRFVSSISRNHLVINIVTQRRRNMVPAMAKNLLAMIHLESVLKSPIKKSVNQPVLVANDHDEPDEEERHSSQLSHLKGPGYVRHIVQDYVRQGWVSTIRPI